MNRLDRTNAFLFLALGGLILAGCGDTATDADAAPEPVPGTLEARLTDHADLGAVVLTFEGTDATGPIAEPPRAARDDLHVFAAPTDQGWRLAVIGKELTGPLVRWDVPDVGLAEDYRVRVVEAADRANEPRPATGTVAVGVR